MKIVLLFLLECFLTYVGADVQLNNKTFPSDFMFGCATAAFQIEGAWNEDGRGECVWDRFVHTKPSRIVNQDTADIACDSYHKYKEDVANLVHLGVTHYRFSISWPRLLPTGLTDNINNAAVTYYTNLIKELKSNNIEPLVTLLHYDTPQAIEDMGGVPNSNFPKWFSEYAKLCFKLFGKDVKYWLTFNEVRAQCVGGYGLGFYAPGIHQSGIEDYKCIYNVVRAHAATWHIYNDEFRATQKGKVGIVIDSDWYHPENETLQKDIDASQQMMLFQIGTIVHPLFYGDYPDIVKETIKRRSLAQGYSESRLPQFTEEERVKLKGTVDIFAMNIYSSSLVRFSEPNSDGKGLLSDCEVYDYKPAEWERTTDGGIAVAPWGAGELVKWISKTYGNPPIIITENGYSDNTVELHDSKRISYIQRYLSSIKDAMDNHGVNVKGYMVWSLIDNFEWLKGYTIKYGLYSVDFNDPARPRTARDSAAFYKKLIKTRCLVDNCVNS